MTPLQELVVNRMAELGLSFRRAADKSGGMVSHSTLSNIALGAHGGKFEPDTLPGIALALDLPLSKVETAAGGRESAPPVFKLPKEANYLTASERRAVEVMVRALLEGHKHSSADGQKSDGR